MLKRIYKLNLVIEELEEMLNSCDLDGEEDGEFAKQLTRAIDVLKNDK